MNRVQQYLPGFVDPVNVEREVAVAATLDELRALPWVRKWEEQDGFRRFSVTKDTTMRPQWDWRGPGVRALMAELDDGKKWYVVAGLEDADRYNLPAWEPVR